MRHTHTRIAGGDVNIGRITGIPTNESQPIDRFQDLSRPAVVDLLDHREPYPGPLFQALIAIVAIVRLTSFVIFTPDDQNILAVGCCSLLDSDVVVRVRLIPVQGGGHSILWHPRSNDIGGIGGLFRVYHEHVVDGDVRGHENRMSRDGVPGSGFNVRWGPALYVLDVAVCEDLPTPPF